MHEVTLSSVTLGTVGVFAPAAALDAITAPSGTRPFRVAPDELALLCPPADRGIVLEAVTPQASAAGGFVLDLSDGWTCWRLTGDIERAFSYLSELHLPADGIIQGDVLRVPVRAVRGGDTLDLHVPSPWSAYLYDGMCEALSAMNLTLTEEATA